MDRAQFKNSLFSGTFSEELALELFRYQSNMVPVYKRYVDLLGVDRQKVKKLTDIPFLPIRFFKEFRVGTEKRDHEIIFRSSGTTGQIPSCHYVQDEDLYRSSIRNGFLSRYGNPKNYSFRFLLPSYLERSDSSLVYMAKYLADLSDMNKEVFFLNDLEGLVRSIQEDPSGRKIFLLGVTFALLKLADLSPLGLEDIILMETGGMKGQGRELIRTELHERLKAGLGIDHVHGEYGMTELLSQAYAKSAGLYEPSSTMKVLIRKTDDPFDYQEVGQTGALNIIDLCNIDSCAFIATDDLVRSHTNGHFEVLGRFDQAELRGCNLMAL